MKNKLLGILIFGLIVVSCSVDKVLKLNDDLNVILLETIDLPEKHVGDTIRFKVFASTNDFIERMVLSNATHDFSGMMMEGGIRYEILDDTIHIDKDGYFSRPVSSIVVNYPVIVTRQLLRQIVGLDFTFYTNKGVSAHTRAQMKVINYMYNSTKKDVYGLAKIEKKRPTEMESPTDTVKQVFVGTPLYSSKLHEVYGFTSLLPPEDGTKEEEGKDSKPKGPELVKYIDVFEFQNTLGDSIYRFYSPDNIEVQKIADLYGQVYNYKDMRHTRFMKLGEDFAFDTAADEQICPLDFTNATEIIVFEYGDNIAFITQDGIKGVMNISKNQRVSGEVTPVIVVKVQTVAE